MSWLLLTNRSGLIAIFVLVIVLVAVYSGWWWAQGSQPLNHRLEDTRAEIALTPQQERARRVLAIALAAKSFDEAALQLDDNRDDAVQLGIATASEATGAPGVLLIFNSILKDRRVARLYEFLQQMEPDTARARCIALYNRKMELLLEKWNRLGHLFKDAEIPIVSSDLQQRHYSVSASVFLVSMLCSADETDRVCCDWALKIRDAMTQCGVDGDKYESEFGVPVSHLLADELFLVNIYAVVAKRSGCEYPDSMPLMRAEPFGKSNSKVGADTEEEILVPEIPLVISWGGLPAGAVRKDVVPRIRGKLRACGFLKSETP